MKESIDINKKNIWRGNDEGREEVDEHQRTVSAVSFKNNIITVLSFWFWGHKESNREKSLIHAAFLPQNDKKKKFWKHCLIVCGYLGFENRGESQLSFTVIMFRKNPNSFVIFRATRVPTLKHQNFVGIFSSNKLKNMHLGKTVLVYPFIMKTESKHLNN